MIFLLPRLPGPAADRLLDQMLDGTEFRWTGFAAESLPDCVRFAATGGSTVAAGRLAALRSGLVEVASRHGFPGKANRDALARFDAALADWMASAEELGTGEALRDDVWAFFGVVMAPDVVNWRFGNARERYVGGVRNTFQRVWMRAVALDRGISHPERWGLLEQLTEDALVQITERPSIGADPVLARELGEAWVRTAARIGRARMEPVMRLATLRLRIRNEVQALSLLPDELPRILDQVFDAASVESMAPAPTPTQDNAGSSLDSEDGAPSSSDRSKTRRSSWAIFRAR